MNPPDLPTKQTPVCWNDPVILDAAGLKPEQVQELLVRNGQPKPTQYAVYQWASRKRIPNLWRARAIYCLLRERKLDIALMFKKGGGGSVMGPGQD